ncbi:MAG: hypothetical protein J6U01_10785 [Clostridia bacterium]|nr:hypothetical protein [Clostridia bacterium]
MTDVLLIFAFLLIGFCGYRIVTRLDRFLDEHVKEEEEKEDEPRRG